MLDLNLNIFRHRWKKLLALENIWDKMDPQSMYVLTNQAVEIKKRTLLLISRFLNCQDLYGVVVELVNT